MLRILIAIVLCLGWAAAHADDNRRLWEIFEADQKSREGDAIDWQAMAEQDRAHRAEVLSLIRSNALHTSNDYFNAALVFQHGDTTDDYLLALGLAQIAATLDPDNKAALWLTAAAVDRLDLPRDEVVMVGDDVRADVDGAQQSGLAGVLVRTGKFTMADLHGDITPQAVLDSVADLPSWWEQASSA